MKDLKLFLCFLAGIVLFFVIAAGTDVERRVTTAYDIYGRPVDQSQYNKGLHTVMGVTTLASGVDTLSLNTSVAEGRQDISFQSETTYHGTAWSLDATNTNTYRVIPLSGHRFVVKSSSGVDTATVRFFLEGQ